MRRILFVLGLFCAVPHLAAAQRTGYVELVPPPTHERWFVSFGASLVPYGAQPFSNRFGTPNLFLPAVVETVGADYRPRGAFGTDVGFGFMATSRFGIGATRTRVRYDNIGLHTYSTRPRLFRRGTLIYQDGVFIDTNDSAAHRLEQAYHLEISAVPVRGRHTIVRAFAGPSRFKISQGLARVIEPVDAYVREQNSVDGSAWGYHAGADFVFYIPNRHSPLVGLGFGTSIRFTTATVHSINGLNAAEPQDYDAGGWHWSLGMRARF
jgi:opacity protein-like surface antigen